jgi:sugar/nucleoside kinase (ribokinase family)
MSPTTSPRLCRLTRARPTPRAGNLKEELMRQVCALAAEGGAPVWFEPVSVAKAIQGVPFLSHFHWVSPNEDELLAMAAALSAHHHQGPSTTTLARGDDEPPGVRTHSPDAHAAVAAAAEALLDAGVACVVTTRGARGALLSTRRACSGDRGYGYTHRALAALPATVLNVSGAGDSLVAGTLAALLAGHAPEAAVAVSVCIRLCGRVWRYCTVTLLPLFQVGMVAAKHAVQAAGNAPEGLEWAAAEEEARTVVTSDW